MPLKKLSYSKDWNNPADFPTIETSEEQVRSDMQLLYDEVKDFLNRGLIPSLESLGVERTVQMAEENGVKYLRVNADNVLEVSADGESWTATGAYYYVTNPSAGSVLYQTVQQLSDQQKSTARKNIGAVSQSELASAVSEALGDYPAALAALDAVIGGAE